MTVTTIPEIIETATITSNNLLVLSSIRGNKINKQALRNRITSNSSHLIKPINSQHIISNNNRTRISNNIALRIIETEAAKEIMVVSVNAVINEVVRTKMAVWVDLHRISDPSSSHLAFQQETYPPLKPEQTHRRNSLVDVAFLSEICRTTPMMNR